MWNSPVTGECSAQRANNAENVSIWWRHHGCLDYGFSIDILSGLLLDNLRWSTNIRLMYIGIKDRAHLSTFEFFILEKFSCIVVLIVFFVIVQSSGLISVWFRQNMTFFINFISFHIFAIYVGGACWGLPAACRLIAVSGARLPSVDGLTVRYIKNAPLLNLPSKYVCDLFQTCFQYMYVRYKHTGTMLLCLQVALSFI